MSQVLDFKTGKRLTDKEVQQLKVKLVLVSRMNQRLDDFFKKGATNERAD